MDFSFAEVAAVLVGAVGLILNVSQLIHLLCRLKSTVFNKTLVSLCISDILSCFSFIGSGLASIRESNRAVIYTATALNVLIAGSVFHLIFIGLQRQVAVTLPLRTKQIFDTRRCTLILCLIWAAATTYGILVYNVSSNYTNVINSITIFGSGAVLVALYIGIAYKIRKRDRFIRNASQSNQYQQSRSVFLHSACVTIAFVVSYFPFATTELFITSSSLPSYFLHSLIAVKHIIDPLVYFCLQCQRHQKSKHLAKAQ